MFHSLPQDVQHISNRYVQELHKQDVLIEIQSTNIIEFHYKKGLFISFMNNMILLNQLFQWKNL